MYYNVCPICGANLDPGEKCNCEQMEAQALQGLLDKAFALNELPGAHTIAKPDCNEANALKKRPSVREHETGKSVVKNKHVQFSTNSMKCQV